MSYRVVFYGCGIPLQTEDIQLPSIRQGELLCKIKLTTVCGSDLHTMTGKRRVETPSILGHEAVVEVVSSKRDGFQSGDRITFSLIDCCGECDRCLSGMQQKCRKVFKYGHSVVSDGCGWNGCYASHIVLRQGTFCVHIPHHIPDSSAAPINCALATVVNAVSHLPDLEGKSPKVARTALVQGAGMLGLYACALLKETGFHTIYCCDMNEDRLKLSSLFGAMPVHTGSSELQHILDEGVIDVVIEACGVSSVVSDGVRALRPGGIYVLVGLVHPDSQLNITAEQIIRKCLTIKGIHNYANRHLEYAVEFISRTISKYPYDRLVSPPYPLRQLSTAIDAAFSQQYLRIGVVP